MPLDEIKRMMRSRKKYFSELKDRYAIITDKDLKRMLDFANKITPRKWNVWSAGCIDYRPKAEKGYLNIYLKLYEGQVVDEDIDYRGQYRGRIEYLDGVANTEFLIHPHMGDWPFVVMHELAHVAVDRRLSFTHKSYKEPDYNICGFSLYDIEGHGSEFERALSLIWDRFSNAYPDYNYLLEYRIMHYQLRKKQS